VAKVHFADIFAGSRSRLHFDGRCGGRRKGGEWKMGVWEVLGDRDVGVSDEGWLVGTEFYY
jgi:hypothetical protein